MSAVAASGAFSRKSMNVAPVGELDRHEAAAAEAAGGREHHAERITDCDRGVDRVAASLQDVDADLGGEVLAGDDHAVAGADRSRRRGMRWCRWQMQARRRARNGCVAYSTLYSNDRKVIAQAGIGSTCRVRGGACRAVAEAYHRTAAGRTSAGGHRVARRVVTKVGIDTVAQRQGANERREAHDRDEQAGAAEAGRRA
jgi:hypothetical protein